MNPYEPPQTIEGSLPVATAQYSFVRTREGLIRATGFCVEGGRFQFAAGLTGILAVLFSLPRDDFFEFDEHLGKLLLLMSCVMTVVLWTWGAIKNYRGYSGLAEYVTNDRVQNYYALCQIHWWAQFFALIMLFFVATGWRHDQTAFSAGILVLLLLSYLHASLIHAQTYRYWYARLELHSTSRGSVAGGLAVVILLALEAALLLLQSRDYAALHVLLSFVLAVTAWDYAQRYQAIQEELREQRD